MTTLPPHTPASRPETGSGPAPPGDKPPAATLLGRALARRCPYCGAPGIFDGWWSLRDRCPRCGVAFAREEGYFLGAYALNLIVAETLALLIALYLIFRTRLGDAALLWQEVVAVALAVGLPIIFYPFSRTLWIALDLFFHPPRSTPERPRRGDDFGHRSRETRGDDQQQV